MKRLKVVFLLGLMVVLSGCNIKEKVGLQETQSIEETIVQDIVEEMTSVVEEPTLTKGQQKVIESVENLDSFEGVLNTSIGVRIPMTTEQKEEFEKLGNDASYAYYNVTLNTNVNIVTTKELSNIYGYTTGDTIKETNIPVNIYKDTVNDIEYVDNYTKSTGRHLWVTNKENSNTVLEDLKMLAENIHDIYETPQDGRNYYKGRISTEYIKKLDYISLADTTYIDIKSGEDVEIPITFVVKDKTNQLESIKFDLTEMVKSVDETVTVKKTECAFTITKYGNVVLGIPEDVKNSKGELQALVSDSKSVYKKYYEETYGNEVTEEIVVRIVQDKLGHVYDNLLVLEEGKENVIVDKLKTFFEHNTEEELRDYIVYYKYCSEEEQIAYCMMTLFDFEGFTESYLKEQGILTGTVVDKLNEYMVTNNLVSDAPVDTKKEDSKGSENKEQSSTTGGTGNSSTPTNQGTLSDGSQGEAQGMSPEAAAAKWGIEYLGGSGLDTSGFDHGSGGAGWQLQ